MTGKSQQPDMASILLQRDVAPDPEMVGAVLTRRMGYAMTDGKRAALRARGLLLASVPAGPALVAVQDLRGMGVDCYCVAETLMKPLPVARRIVTAEWTDEALKFRSSSESQFETVPWRSVTVIVAGLLKTQEFREATEAVLLPNLPVIHAIDDTEAKEALRKGLAALVTKRKDQVTHEVIEERTGLAEKHDAVAVRLVEKGSKLGLVGYMDVWIDRGDTEGPKEIRLRAVSSEFTFSGLGNAIMGSTMENFRRLVEEFRSRARSAKLSDSCNEVLKTGTVSSTAIFDSVKQFESYARWFLQIDRLAGHPDEFETGAVAAGPDPVSAGAPAPAVVASPVEAAEPRPEAGLEGVKWQGYDYLLMLVAMISMLAACDVVWRIWAGSIGSSEPFFGMQASMATVGLCFFILCAGVILLWEAMAGPAWDKRVMLIALTALFVYTAVWKHMAYASDDRKVRAATLAFFDEVGQRRARIEAERGQLGVLENYFTPGCVQELTRIDRIGAEASVTVLVNGQFPLTFWLAREDDVWVVDRVFRVVERNELIDPKTSEYEKKLKIEPLYRR
ncbi:MAG: hypothetical protein RDV41_10320 [Planctomycetota bacterium]|nr:hypothetical protein [Planctomycetota bacterium]